MLWVGLYMHTLQIYQCPNLMNLTHVLIPQKPVFIDRRLKFKNLIQISGTNHMLLNPIPAGGGIHLTPPVVFFT